jgi:hypothetical protein
MSSIAFKSAATIVARRLCTSAVRRAAGPEKGVIPSKISNYKGIQHLQTEMLTDESHLIWQKRGAVDKALYGGTLVTGVGALCYAVYLILYMAFPHQKN